MGVALLVHVTLYLGMYLYESQAKRIKRLVAA